MSSDTLIDYSPISTDELRLIIKRAEERLKRVDNVQDCYEDHLIAASALAELKKRKAPYPW